MPHTVELEEVNLVLNGVTVEASHLRAFQTNQSAPSDIINFAAPYQVGLELEFGGPFGGIPLAFTITYFFECLTGAPGPAPAPVVVGPILTLPGVRHYSALAPAGALTVAAGPALVPNNAYRVGAIVKITFPGGGLTLFKGFIDGLVLSDD